MFICSLVHCCNDCTHNSPNHSTKRLISLRFIRRIVSLGCCSLVIATGQIVGYCAHKCAQHPQFAPNALHEQISHHTNALRVVMAGPHNRHTQRVLPRAGAWSLWYGVARLAITGTARLYR